MPPIDREEFRQGMAEIRGELRAINGKLESQTEARQKQENRLVLLEERMRASSSTRRLLQHVGAGIATSGAVLWLERIFQHGRP